MSNFTQCIYENFYRYREQKIAFYGIGKNAQRLLEVFSEYNVLYLIDDQHAGEFVFGKEVVSLQQAVQAVSVIIIAATPSSTKIVAARILPRVPMGIPVYDMYGRQLITKTYRPAALSMGGADKIALGLEDNIAFRYVYSQVHTSNDLSLLEQECSLFKRLITLDQKVLFDDISTFGALCIAPITLQFMSFLFKQLQHKQSAMLLFASRDGYYLHKLYEYIRRNCEVDLPASAYLYTSRQAASLTMLRTEEDILAVCSNILSDPPKNNLRQELQARFRVDFPKIFDITIQHAIEKFGQQMLLKQILEMSVSILTRAAQVRNNYLQYIQSLGIDEYNELYVVDLVTRGTVAGSLTKLLQRDVNLLAFLTPRFPNANISNPKLADAMFHAGHHLMGELGIVLEIAYASSEGQFLEITDEGEKVFLPKSGYDTALLAGIQQGVDTFIQSFIKKNPQWIEQGFSSGLAVNFLNLVSPRFSDFSLDIGRKFIMYDPFQPIRDMNVLDMTRKKNL